ncbi:hypothetical protein DFJ74DRAFT_766502 [Hyaloraphidium curvatum]|nr:hypothetical protein DFJ74DRAFT_766502 [Hyaloraphidium curvatum]
MRLLALAVLALAAGAAADDGGAAADDGGAAHDYDPDAFHARMRTASGFANHVVYAPHGSHGVWAHGDSLVVEGGGVGGEEEGGEGGEAEAASGGDRHGGEARLGRRDRVLDDIEPALLPRRVIRRVAGCPAAASFSLSPDRLDAGAPFDLRIANMEAVGIDFGDGVPQFFAFWNASVVEINGQATTTLTTVGDQPVTTSGAGFDGCFPTLSVPLAVTATLTQLGESATMTPNVAGRYFVDATVSPGLHSTRFPFQITTTPYTFVPPTDYVAPPVQTPTATVPQPRDCADPPRMAGGLRTDFPIYTGNVAGAPVTVTLDNVRESVVSWTEGQKTTTYEAVYRAGEMRTFSTYTTASGKTTATSTKMVTVAGGRMVTTRRYATTALDNSRDGCIARLVDAANWVVPAAGVADDAVMLLAGRVGDDEVMGVGLMAGAMTTPVFPYPTDVPLPTRPTSIPATSCSPFYAYVTPTSVTPGQVVTLQLFNVPATPVRLLASGYSTVYEARYAATVLSNFLAVSAVPTRTWTATVRTPGCVNISTSVTVAAQTRFLPLTAAPSPTAVYQVRARARDFGRPGGGEVESVQTFYLNRGPNTPESVLARSYPCLVGPLRTRTAIRYSNATWAARFYSLARNTSRGVTTTRLTWTLGTNGRGRMSFIARDYAAPRTRLDMYETNAFRLPRPADWSVEWTATGAFTGRTMPPFTVTTDYIADGLLFPNGTAVPSSRADLRIRHSVTVHPYWPRTPKGSRPTVAFNVTAPTYGSMDNVTMLCAHPGAKRAAFVVVPMGALKERPGEADLAAAVSSARWTFVTDRAGRWVPRARAAIYPRSLGPLSEIAARWASDGDGGGMRTGGENPNAPKGSPPAAELERQLAAFRQV